MYIGPACVELCGGHGNCNPESYPSCLCDDGRKGDNCYPWKVENLVSSEEIYAWLIFIRVTTLIFFQFKNLKLTILHITNIVHTWRLDLVFHLI